MTIGNVISFLLGAVIAGTIVAYERKYNYMDGYKEGWLDARERYIEKLRQIGNQELVDDFVNSLREP